MASTSIKPKILVFGSGAIGTIYVYLLLKAGCDVTAVCRSNYTAARDNGFHIDTTHSNNGPYDYLIVCCKAIPSAKTPQTIAPAVTPNYTTIVLIQNGIDIEPEYSLTFPSTPLLTCIAYLPTTQNSPGHITMGNNERLEIGTYPESSKSSTSAEILISLLKSSGSNTTYHPKIQERRWFKLLLNAPWNPICALTLSRDVAFLSSLSSDGISESIIRGVLQEVILLSQSLGYTSITAEAAEAGFKVIKDRVGKMVGIEPSMLVDVLHGRAMEHEVILGNVVRKAREMGIEVPRLEMLYGLTKALDLATQKRKEGRSLDREDLGDVYQA
ncbi:uncharacterized protein MYCFIDRAFT_188267 [Pseudocercospora fijiensis CIRAD86]|uniref:2-dehydropantoate 2-reductase n=1 Tax=Pseudocercospora fijiensis (strain CIRAD86) TaxID=383855 RepID=M3AEV1_PSEFD|nr:uncharacterized protein MYCFIDRAFT_188267 [Pseudocercospora fijiensis CIRAD86]EME83141.1 hypothetical protein MYCFIDRAFT_188267 [Pseudocercospora fijiensis CIRAD86]